MEKKGFCVDRRTVTFMRGKSMPDRGQRTDRGPRKLLPPYYRDVLKEAIILHVAINLFPLINYFCVIKACLRFMRMIQKSIISGRCFRYLYHVETYTLWAWSKWQPTRLVRLYAGMVFIIKKNIWFFHAFALIKFFAAVMLLRGAKTFPARCRARLQHCDVLKQLPSFHGVNDASTIYRKALKGSRRKRAVSPAKRPYQLNCQARSSGLYANRLRYRASHRVTYAAKSK